MAPFGAQTSSARARLDGASYSPARAKNLGGELRLRYSRGAVTATFKSPFPPFRCQAESPFERLGAGQVERPQGKRRGTHRRQASDSPEPLRPGVRAAS